MSDPKPTDDPGWIREADAVFRGGGIKVVGLIGALIGFETHPRRPIERWVSTGGTSSGAIVASYLILHRGPHAAQKLIEELDPERLAGFLDFPLGRKYVGGLPRLLARRGMASGAALEGWLDELLRGATFAIAGPADGSNDWTRSRLKLIAFDVTNRRLLVLPEDLPRYRLPGNRQPIDPATFPIARAVRMSTSIPYLFEPVTLEQIAVPDPSRPGCLLAVTPRPATIVDGGAVSTFPVWLFDDPHPKRPTFGFTLTGGGAFGRGGSAIRRLPWTLEFGFEMYNAAQHAWDERFATRTTNVRTVAVEATVRTPDGADHPIRTTDLRLDRRLRDLLVENGRAAATRYLDEFDPSAHVNSFHASPLSGDDGADRSGKP